MSGSQPTNVDPCGTLGRFVGDCAEGSCWLADRRILFAPTKDDGEAKISFEYYQFNSSFVTPQKLHALCDDTKVHRKIYFKL
jgi:hypothetical protein